MYIYNLHSFKNVEIKPCPHLDWPSGPCYHWLTKDQMLWVTIRLKHRCFENHFRTPPPLWNERQRTRVSLTISWNRLWNYNNDTSETRALISEEIDRKRSVVLISCKWYLCSNIRLFVLRMLQGARLLPYLLSFHSSLFFASPDGNSLTNLSLFLHLFWIAP